MLQDCELLCVCLQDAADLERLKNHVGILSKDKNFAMVTSHPSILDALSGAISPSSSRLVVIFVK